MSTRANIVLKDEYGDTLWFYRHSDGYPDGAMPLLEKFMGYVKAGQIRDNAEQAGGWLILLGAMEYTIHMPDEAGKWQYYEWKVGSIEPATGQHGDIEYLYTIDLKEKTISYIEV